MNNLHNIVSKLSKSSAEAVHTFSKENSSIFEYLHTITPVEEKYIEILTQQKGKKSLIFLSGSSGDGKSAIIAKNKDAFESDYDFHVDATHSFKSNQTATEALDSSFHKYFKGNKSLVVGINIGILMNYVEEGETEFSEIKENIKTFLESKENTENTFFINFDDYSKFEFNSSKVSSPFIQSIFKKITLHSDNNPFYRAFLKDTEENSISALHQNFKLLSVESIQESIIELLITINLKYDQFLTTRSLLDLVYVLLTAKDSLINKLFEDTSTSMMKNLSKEDPLQNRSYQLDKFILDRASGKEDEKLIEFIRGFNSLCKKEILNDKDAFLLIRTFYLFRNSSISNDYHKEFTINFDDSKVHSFIHLVASHHEYKDENKKAIKHFYKQLKEAVLFYVNKNAPTLSKHNLVSISTTNGITVAVPVEIEANMSKIKNVTSKSGTSFPLFLKINSEEISTIDITLSIQNMIEQILNGYRPNKHDRNTIVIFDELVQNILAKAVHSKEIVLLSDKKKVHFKNNEDEIEVVEDEA
ncbi:DNA phosphorothioation-dependent restriction protein DptF [Sulfurimonas sp.]|uniref:DNA phosphorothioation-dependent restriction protein DptF n=1 Tax=Sulfurimonas sp. TaxID=2022749 RepID=UPI0035663350